MNSLYLLIDGELVITTSEHPFYTSKNEWVDAGNLVVGDEIHRLDWGTGQVVNSKYAACCRPSN